MNNRSRQLFATLVGMLLLAFIQAGGAPVKGIVTASSVLNLRNGPSEHNAIIGALNHGESVIVYDQLGDWYRLFPANGITGYVRTSALQGNTLRSATALQKTPATNSPLIGLLHESSTVTLQKSIGFWSQVRVTSNSSLGIYAHRSYIALDGARPAIQTPAKPPTLPPPPPPVITAPTPPPKPPIKELKATYGILIYDVTRQKEIWSQNPDKSMPIASLTKMMTLLLCLEKLNDTPSLSLNTYLPISKTAAAAEPTKANLIPGKTVRFDELLSVMILASCNDCANVAGEYIGGGTMAGFALKANERARQLGMTKTHFFNASGLPLHNPEKDNTATPRDLLKLCSAVWKYPQTRKWTNRKTAELTTGIAKPATFKGHTPLLGEFGIDGLKTGYTQRAGSCVATHAKNASGEYFIIILGCEQRVIRNDILKDIMVWLTQKNK